MWLLDKMVNLVSGLGTAKDKITGNTFALQVITLPQLEAMYRSDWLARKIVDVIPFDMTREWRNWQAEASVIETLEKVERELKVKSKINHAQTRARLYGGAVLYMGIEGAGEPSEPLNLNAVKKGALKYLHVLPAHRITVEELERDPLSPYYGEPKLYRIGGTAEVHPSRIIRFIGAEVPDPVETNSVWGDSILQIVYDAVQNAASSQGHVASLLPEMKTDVIRVPGLSDILSTDEGTSRLTTRFTYANTLKSMFNMLLLEGNGEEGEKWEQKQINFSGVPDLIRMFLQVAAGAADIPVTRLLGQSPAGLNSTGEGDIRNYYDHVVAKQNSELRPALDRLDEVLIRHALGNRPEDIWYEFAPLWQLSDKEKAEVDHKKAQTTDLYVKTGLLPQEALAKGVQNQLIEDGTYPGFEQAIAEAPDVDFEEEAEREAEATAALAAAREAQGNDLQDAAPRTLYVSRSVENASELIAWAKAQGFTSTLKPEDLHVTIAFSRQPLDWMKVGNASEFAEKDGKIVISRGGPRLVEPLGDKGAIVLLFSSWELNWRHEAIREAGASWDHEGYQPHITITYDPGEVDVSKVEPYTGTIVLGPEKFAEVDEDWGEKAKSRQVS